MCMQLSLTSDHGNIGKAAKMPASIAYAYSESCAAVCAAFLRDMPESGMLVEVNASGGEGTCTETCTSG